MRLLGHVAKLYPAMYTRAFHYDYKRPTSNMERACWTTTSHMESKIWTMQKDL